MQNKASDVLRGIGEVLSTPPRPAEPQPVKVECKCAICWDLGAIDTKQKRQEYGTLAWMNAGIPPEGIVWCECEMGPRAREMYTEEFERRDSAKAQARLEKQFELAGVPPRFHDMQLPMPGDWSKDAMTRKVRAYAACRMMMAEGCVTPSKLHVYDINAAIRPGEKVVRPDHAYKSLALLGPKGVGKTAALSAVFRHFLGLGVAGIWLEWYDAVGEVQAGYSSDSEFNPEDKIRSIQQAPLVMIDDLGDLERTTRETDDRRRILWRILGHRHNNDLMTLLSSNLDEAGLRTQFDGRIIDRLHEMAFVCPMNGANLRKTELGVI